MKTIQLLSFLLISALTFGQQMDYSKVAQLQTKATYTQEVYADKITLSITLAEANTKGKVSVEKLEQRLKKTLLDNNIDLKTQLTLSNMGSNFRDYFLRKTDVQKVKNYELELYDAVTAGNILKGLESQDISNVRLLKTEYSKLEELKVELKGKAVEKAKKQAEEMLKPLDQVLGPAIFVSDLQTEVYPMMRATNSRFNANLSNEANSNSPLDVNFDKIKVEATVTVYFRLN